MKNLLLLLIMDLSYLGKVCDVYSREDEMEMEMEKWRIGCECAIVLARHFCILLLREREGEGLVVLPSSS